MYNCALWKRTKYPAVVLPSNCRIMTFRGAKEISDDGTEQLEPIIILSEDITDFPIGKLKIYKALKTSISHNIIVGQNYDRSIDLSIRNLNRSWDFVGDVFGKTLCKV